MTAYDPTAVLSSPTDWVARQAAEYETSGGTRGTDTGGAPSLLLDHRGRVSGAWHRTVLIYGRDGADHLVVASNSGSADHPQWYRNLVVHPEAYVRVGTERFAARAETLSPTEKTRVWPHLLEVFAPYAEFQQRTGRDIPVVRLSRCPSDG